MKRSEALQKFETAMRLENKSLATRKQYKGWVERYFNFIDKSPNIKPLPSKAKLQAFINHLVEQTPQPSYSNQKQAHFALQFFYKSVMGIKMEIDSPRGRRDQKTFNVLTRDQVRKLLSITPEEYKLIISLLYGTGMRIDECLSLRIKDIDFDHNLIYVQEGKGDKARRVDLPPSLIEELKYQVESSRSLHEYDQNCGKGGVYIPHLLAKKNPSLEKSVEWFWVFPNLNFGKDPESGKIMRHHVYIFSVQKAFRELRKSAKLPVYLTPHALRHAYATHYLESVLAELPSNIPNIGRFARDLLREKMGHVSAETTDIYIHLATPKHKIMDRSPLTDLISQG